MGTYSPKLVKNFVEQLFHVHNLLGVFVIYILQVEVCLSTFNFTICVESERDI